MKTGYFYTVYIDKETLDSDIVKLDMNINFTMDLPAPPVSGTPDKSREAEKINTCQKTKGGLRILDLGKPFVEPDVKSAKPLGNQ
ncbi:MAG: hypothetical protein ACOY30_05905 [Bacillota bacterium]